MFNRRMFLGTSILAGSYYTVPGLFAEQLTLTPKQTDGPFYPDNLPLDTDNDLIIINDKITPAVGQITHIAGKILDANGSPIKNAVVEIWQCDHDGVYRHSHSSGPVPMAFQGFGKVQVGADGRYRFRTIKPAPYPGRPPHIHVKVKLGSKELLTTQMYIAGEQANADDILLRGLDPQTRSLLEVPFTRGLNGLQAEFGIVVAA